MKQVDLTDKEAYDAQYSEKQPGAEWPNHAHEYQIRFEDTEVAPFHRSGKTKGYARGQALTALLDSLQDTNPTRQLVLDAGAGTGVLSSYLAARGYRVVSLDISKVGVSHCVGLARHVGVDERVMGVAATLNSIPLPNESVDGVIGFASLHHFIKYPGVAGELFRIMKPGALSAFADSFGENPAYHVFHDKEKMRRLGDVVLNRKLLNDFFRDFQLELRPTDWFSMLDKLLLRLLPARAGTAVRAFGRVTHALDRLIPRTRATLALSGSVVSLARKPPKP